MKIKNIILLAMTLCLLPFDLFSQISEVDTSVVDTLLLSGLDLHPNLDSSKKCYKHKEKIICIEEEAVDSHARIETLEIGFNTSKDITFFTSIKFPVNDIASGRLFIGSFRINKNGNGKPGHYSTGAIDLTLFNSPIDFAFGLDNDRLGKNPYRRSEFVGAAFYFNEVRRLHKVFHIFRYSPSWHFYHVGEGDSSIQENGLQHSVFMQSQPIRVGKKLMISTETYLLARKGSNLFEFDLGLRHKNMMKERLVVGTTFSFHDSHYHGTMVFARLSIMQTTGVKHNWGGKYNWKSTRKYKSI